MSPNEYKKQCQICDQIWRSYSREELEQLIEKNPCNCEMEGLEPNIEELHGDYL